MRKNEVFPYYRQCCKDFEIAYEYIKSLFSDTYVDELCQMRGYVGKEQRNLIQSMQLGCCEIEDLDLLGENAKNLGLVTENNNFILNNRYVIPVYDMVGNLVSLIGYFNDRKKYITVSSPYFSKEMMLFNYKQAYDLSWSEFDGYVILVEGIFDCLSLRSLGLPAVATMGANVPYNKGLLLRNFKKVLCVPDDDATGRRSLNRYSRYGWKVPSNATFLRLHGGLFEMGDGESLHCKDMDDFVSWYEADDVREILLSYRNSKEDIEDLYL